MSSSRDYTYNQPSPICYYVNLNTYTKGKFGNTNFQPPLTQPIVKTKVSFDMSNYNSLSDPSRTCSHNTNNFISYPLLGSAYQKPICNICSINDC